MTTRTFIGPFHRFAVTVETDSVQVWDAERTDAKGLATVVYTAATYTEAFAWARQAVAADPSMQMDEE